MRKVLIGAIVAQVLIGGLAYAGPAQAPAGACSSSNDVPLDTFEVAVEADSRDYRRGQVARLTVTVNRHVEGTPVSVPAEDVLVVSFGTTGALPMAGAGMTDADGQTQVKLRIPKDAPRGWVDVSTRATRSVAWGPCISVDEQGSVREKRLFRIKR